MKETALFRIHQGLGAKMVPFAGFQMPLEYSGIKDEHVNVRNAIGIFDVSHMGEFRIKGTAAKEFLQKVTSNDIQKLIKGKIQSKIKSMTIDRKNNSKGYEYGNIVKACWLCNKIKGPFLTSSQMKMVAPNLIEELKAEINHSKAKEKVEGWKAK